MKKRFLSVLVLLAMLTQLLALSALAYPVPDYGPQAPTAKFAAGIPMSVSHRADWRNAPENSLLAIQSCIDMGIDVVELDVKLTSDGVVVLSHDGSISRCTGVGWNIGDYTWEELRTIPLKNNQGSGAPIYNLTEADAALLNGLTHYAEHTGAPATAGGTMPLTRLDDAIELIDHQVMINLDHCFNQNLFVACYVLFRETGMLDHVFFKNSVDSNAMNQWYAAAAAKWNELHPEAEIQPADVQSSILYVYILHPGADGSPAALQSHLDNGDNLVMVEVCISNDDILEAIDQNLEPWCLQRGITLFVNTMWSGLCGTKPDTQTTWAMMLNRGYRAIQTDRPGELSVYLNAINNPRTSTGVIEAEHFNDFNSDSFGFSVNAGHTAELNKYVENARSGDWWVYDNVVFDGTEAMLSAQIRGRAEDATLLFYVDGTTAEDLIASVTLGNDAAYTAYTAELNHPVEAGRHTLYVVCRGLPDQALVNLDSYRFLSGAQFSGTPSMEEISAVTVPGTAPTLPGSITVTYGEESYGFGVRWEQIAPEAYAQAGEFSVLGYVPMLARYTSASVTVRDIAPAVAEDGLALWLDASEGVSADETGAVTAWTSKVGDITATRKDGSPTLVDPAAGQAAGIRFDGNDAMNLVLPDDFWNNKSAFTVLMYTAPECTTSGASNGTASQYNSVLYFGETGDWGSAYFTASQNEVILRFGSGSSGDYGSVYVRPENTGSLYTATAIRKNGTDNTVFVDGEPVWSGYAASGTTRNISPSGWIGLGKNGNYHKGTVCEILIYDRALSDDEILAAQSYLAEKYADSIASVDPVEVTCTAGTAPELPGTVTVRYTNGQTAQAGVSWSPIHPNRYQSEGTFTVSGTLATGQTAQATVTVVSTPQVSDPFEDVLLWFSAQYGVTAGEDGKVSSWSAKTANGEISATQSDTAKMPTAVTDDQDNVTGIHFDGNDLMTFNSLEPEYFNGYSGMTAVIYSTPEITAPSAINSNHNNSLLYINEFGGSRDWSGLYLGTFTNGMAGRFGTGTSKNRGVLYTKGSYSGTTTTVLIKDGSSDKVVINGETITGFVTDSGTPANTTANIKASDGKLGAGKSGSWKGTAQEIILFDHALSDEELEIVYARLHSAYLPAPAIPEDGLMFWMDASQGVTTDEAGNVNAWASRVGDLTATFKTNTSVKPTLNETAYNGKPGVHFTNGVLQMPLATGAFDNLTGVTAVVVAAPELAVQSHSSNRNFNVQRNTLFYVDEDTSRGGWASFYVGIYTDGISARFGTGTANDYGLYNPPREPVTDFSTTTIRWDGAEYQAEVDGTAFGSASSLGSRTNNNKNIVYLGAGKDNKLWKGTVCEILLYDRVLSDAELQGIYSAFAEKYPPVEDTTVPATGVYLEEAGTRLTLHRGDTRQLTAAVLPVNADNQNLLWSSSDDSVAAVDENGRITAAGLGSAAVTVTTEDGSFRAFCTVRVTQTEEELLWRDIQTVVDWADRQDADKFSNWETMEDALTQVDGVSAQSSAAELTAVYTALREAIQLLLPEVDTAVVTFEANGGSAVTAQRVYVGASATRPDDPTRVDHRFLGWFTDEACTQTYDFSTPVEDSLTLYAGWEEIPQVVPHVHLWSDWTITQAPTNREDGEMARICYGCGAVQLATIPAELEDPDVPLAGVLPYEDVAETAWYREAVQYIYDSDLLDGQSESLFAPEMGITRGAFVNALYQLEGSPEAPAADFADVTAGTLYADAIGWAAANKIAQGYSHGVLFRPEQVISRQEMTVLLSRYVQFKGLEQTAVGKLEDFRDGVDTSDWAVEDMTWAIGAGIITGKNHSILDPRGDATRAEAALVLLRLDQTFFPDDETEE